MHVIKRSGKLEPVQFDKITSRIRRLCYGLSMKHVDPVMIAQKAVEGMYDGITTSEIDSLAAEIAATMTATHPDYATLAARIAVSNLHKNTKKSFSETAAELRNYVDPKTGEPAPMLSEEVYGIIHDHANRLDSALIYDRDYSYDYFGFKTLEKKYLFRVNGKVVERPQHLVMRVALGIHKDDLEAALESYELMSQGLFTHATPTLYNSGTPRSMFSSCFLLGIGDSIPEIYGTLKEYALISQAGAGAGMNIHDIRATGSYIKGTTGTSNGIVPMLKVFNETARYVDQGGGKRKGVIAIYLEPWHADVFDFLDLRKNTGKEERRARDIFTAMWIPDLFMRRVEADGQWSLMCPKECPGLADVWGKKFDKLYERYEVEGRARKTVPARAIWAKILESQIETGNPYMLYKDAANTKSNQSNLGTIRGSNLCTEIMEYHDGQETAVCNLASIALPKFVEDGKFDFVHLSQIAGTITRNLNRIIDGNDYPSEKTKRSNLRHRPIGIGVQGLADTFALLRLPFDSNEAKALNRDIFEAMYFGAMKASMELAKRDGYYESFPCSPLSEGKFQFDLWGVEHSDRWDWGGLRQDVICYGARNSLLLAPMPTATTAQILGNNECFEPYTSNIYSRRTLTGDFVVVNKHLMRDLVEAGLWSKEMKNRIVAANGSVQGIDEIPEDIRALYKTVWEISQKTIIDMAADRGAFICQSQSMNLFISDPSFAKLTSMHFYAWKAGLKTGMYYLRSQAAVNPVKFTLDQARIGKEVPNELLLPAEETRKEEIACSLENPENCEACGS